MHLGPPPRRRSQVAPKAGRCFGQSGSIAQGRDGQGAREDRSAVVGLHDAGFLPLPVVIFLILALIEFPLALGQGDLRLRQGALPVEAGGHAGIALGADCAVDAGKLLTVKQELALAVGAGDFVGARARARVDARPEKPGLAVLKQDVGLHQLAPPLAKGFNFPALKGDPRLEALLEMVIKLRPPIEGDGAAPGGFFLLSAHGAKYTLPRGKALRSSLERGCETPHNLPLRSRGSP